MDKALRAVPKHMLGLGLGALAHANWHANYHSMENKWWSQLSVLQAAHAAEILIKARIAQQHPLLIFEQLPKPPAQKTKLTLEHLLQQGKTYQYSELPDRLWATTGIQIPNLLIYKSFGRLRNTIQHFSSPNDDVSAKAIDFIYGVIDPFINQCWKLYAIDFNEDHEPYKYLVEGLMNRGVTFLVSSGVVDDIDYIDCDFSKYDRKNRAMMTERIEAAKNDKNK